MTMVGRVKSSSQNPNFFHDDTALLFGPIGEALIVYFQQILCKEQWYFR